MCEHVTYRLDQSADHQPSIGFRVLWRTLRRIKASPSPITLTDGDPGYIILEAKCSGVEQKVNYIGRQYPHRPGIFLSKEDAPALLKGTGVVGAYLLAALPIALRCVFFSKQRANRALHIAHLAEATAIRSFLASRKPNAVFDFAPYHIDSNWQYLLNRDMVKEYLKLPSPGPLRTHNAIVLCDTLVISSGYHIDELSTLALVKPKRTLKWLVENAFNYIERYASGSLPEPTSKTLGFYSHGSWIRKASSHRDDGLNIYEAEQRLLSDLADFLVKNKGYRLLIFAHPREKKPEHIEQSRAYYRELLGETPFSFSEPGVRTADAFEEVDLAIAAFSTIVYERLFCGYKILVGNYGMTHFPTTTSPLNAICFDSREKLASQIIRFESMNRDAFFVATKLGHYRYDSYPYFSSDSPPSPTHHAP